MDAPLRRTALGLLLAIVSCLAEPASARTLTQLRSDVRVLISDSGTQSARYRFTDTQVDDFINECQREAVGQAWPLMLATSFELVADDQYYSLPDTFLAVRRVTWENRVLEERSPTILDKTKEWEETEGTPLYYFVTFASRTTLGIYPIPADSSSTGTVKVEYYAQANDLASSSDVPFNGVREFYPFHHVLAYCAAGRLSAIMGRTELTPLYLQTYTQGLARLASTAVARPSSSPAVTPSSGGGGGP